MGEKHSQTMFLIKDSCPEYVRSSSIPTLKQIYQLDIGKGYGQESFIGSNTNDWQVKIIIKITSQQKILIKKKQWGITKLEIKWLYTKKFFKITNSGKTVEIGMQIGTNKMKNRMEIP